MKRLKVGMPYFEIEALLESGRLDLRVERYDNAIHKANDVLKLCDRTGFKLYEPKAELILAKAYLPQGDKEQAKDYAQLSYEKADQMHYHLPKTEATRLLENIEL